MKLSNIRRHIVRSGRALLCFSALTLPLAACDTIIEGEGDCTRVYRVEFIQMNINEVDAFAASVKSVSLFVFDRDGNLAACKTETGDRLRAGGNAMSFDDLAPGTYDLIAWGGLDENDAFELVGGDTPISKEDLACRLDRLYDEDNTAYSDRPLDGLFHAMADEIEFPDAYGIHTVSTLDLVKNTNTVRVILYNHNGRTLEDNRFKFSITDNNGLMNYDNALLQDEYITYREWTKGQKMVDNPELSSRSQDDEFSAVVAEIDVARLVKGQTPVLKVEVVGMDTPVFELPLIDLLLAAKGEARTMSDQTYLDRQDEYNMFFYIDDTYGWYAQGGIFVNGWKIIYQNKEM